MSGPAADILERERRKISALEDELEHTTKMLKQMEARNKDNAISLKLRMTAAIKELENIRITNNELQEEVVTLEARIMEAKRMQCIDEDTIRHLTEELRLKQKQLNTYQTTSVFKTTEPSLAQELASSFPPTPNLINTPNHTHNGVSARDVLTIFPELLNFWLRFLSDVNDIFLSDPVDAKGHKTIGRLNVGAERKTKALAKARRCE